MPDDFFFSFLLAMIRDELDPTAQLTHVLLAERC